MKTPSTTPTRTNGGTVDGEENVARTVAGLLRLRWWCAPMVEQSDCAFRKLCRALKCGVASTPMIQARSFVQSERYRAQWILHGDPMVCATTWPSDSIAQTIPGIREGVPDLHFTLSVADAPLVVQFAGNDPHYLAAATVLVADKCEAVELNLGCPQSCARNGHYGAYLMDDIPLVMQIVRQMKQAAPAVAILAKVRVFEEYHKTLHYCQALQIAGADILTVHARTRQEKRSSASLARWDFIRQLKVDLTIPIIANGNVRWLADAEACLQTTNADGVMSASALLRNPGLFSGQRFSKLQLALAYLHFAKRFPPPPVTVFLHLRYMLKGPLLTLLTPLLGEAMHVLHRKQRTAQVDEAESHIMDVLATAVMDKELANSVHELVYFPRDDNEGLISNIVF